jgi:hypothetical protein
MSYPSWRQTARSKNHGSRLSRRQQNRKRVRRKRNCKEISEEKKKSG